MKKIYESAFAIATSLLLTVAAPLLASGKTPHFSPILSAHLA